MNTYAYAKTSLQMFILASFIIAKKWKHSPGAQGECRFTTNGHKETFLDSGTIPKMDCGGCKNKLIVHLTLMNFMVDK